MISKPSRAASKSKPLAETQAQFVHQPGPMANPRFTPVGCLLDQHAIESLRLSGRILDLEGGTVSDQVRERLPVNDRERRRELHRVEMSGLR